MPKYTFDFNLSLWIRNLEIDAESEDAARKVLNEMSVEDILDEGTVKDTDITSLDVETDEEPDDYEDDYDDEDE